MEPYDYLRYESDDPVGALGRPGSMSTIEMFREQRAALS